MKIRVLGSAAGGGFPQWNCGCINCTSARAGATHVRARTQESVAVSADGGLPGAVAGGDWVLLNCSPEVRAQIESFPALHPRAPRHSPICGVVLTNGDLDHCLGLLSLRESQPLRVYTSAAIRDGFMQDNAFARTLQRFEGQLRWVVLEPGTWVPVLRAGTPTGLSLQAVPVPGKLPIHLEGRCAPSAEDNLGVLVRDTRAQRELAYFPGVGAYRPEIFAMLAQSDACFFDGTFWSSDELGRVAPVQGDDAPSPKRAEDMAHWPVGGRDGSLHALAALVGSTSPALRGGEMVTRPKRVLIHINNTNPLLREDSPEHAQLRAAGVELAYDGMELEL